MRSQKKNVAMLCLFYFLSYIAFVLPYGYMQTFLEYVGYDVVEDVYKRQQNLPCLHFLLNDKKELMHDNQLLKVARFVQDKNIQLVISILKDKLPTAILNNAHIAVELSQKEKLFKIEN